MAQHCSPLLLAALVLPIGVLASCGPATAPPSTAPRSSGSAAVRPGRELEARGLLLLLADRKLYEPFTVDRCREGDADLRRDLAMTLGRVGDRRGRSVLEELLIDPDSEVRRAAAFSLGLLGLPASLPSLGRAAADSDVELGGRAVEAAIRCGADLEWLLTALTSLPPEEIFQRLLPSLHRLSPSEIAAVAPTAMGEGPPELNRRLALALQRKPLADDLPVLRALLGSADAAVLAAAARAMGAVGEASDLGRLTQLVGSVDAVVAIAALQATASLYERGTAAPTAEWSQRLIELFDDPRGGVRLAALRSSSSVAAEEEVVRALARRFDEGAAGERAEALLAIAAGERPAAFDRLALAATDAQPLVREAAARAADRLQAEGVLDRLLADVDPRVRWTAIEGRLRWHPETAESWVKAALLADDPLLRGRAAEWLSRRPLLPVEDLQAAFLRAQADPRDGVRVRLIEALVERAQQQPLERGAVLLSLDELSRHSRYLVRRAVAAGLIRLGEPAAPIGAVETRLANHAYRGVVEQTREVRYLAMETSRGRVVLRLDCRAAPLSCLSFLQLALQGFYDGVAFDSVEPGQWVLGGDPRGDGWGGPGFELRDEPTLLPVQRGTLGLDRPRRDTAGSAFFIALSDLPWREGESAVFGQVESGLGIVEQLLPGDRIVGFSEIVGASSTVR